MRYVIWGIGERLSNYILIINLEQIVCFVDSAKCLEASEYKGKPLIKPEELKNFSYDYILISSYKFFKEISSYCIFELGIDCYKIMMLDYYLYREGVLKHHPTVFLRYRNVLALLDEPEKAGIINKWISNNFLSSRLEGVCLNHGGYLFPVPDLGGSIKIYQVTHKIFNPIKNRGYAAIGVGAQELPYKMDNIGENISKYNAAINECTALYWIWKHSKEDYIGLNHYRRVFESELNPGWPIQDTEAMLLLRRYDAIVAKPAIFEGSTVKVMLSGEICGEAFEQSWRVLLNIFESRDLKEKDAFEQIVSGSLFFPCNMFIMKADRVDEYCRWLFPILFELLDKVEIKREWDPYSMRVIGFWAERLLTVWLCFRECSIKDLPILLIGDGAPFGKA